MAKKPAKPRRPAQPMPPTCSCLVLCDDVIIGHAHGKHRLEGIIGAITPPFLPAIIPPAVIYVRVSNVHQNQKITVALVHADDGNQPIWEIEAEIVNQNKPLDVHTLVARIPPYQLDHAGRYVLEARYQNVPLASAPILVQPQFKGPPPALPGVE